MFTTSQIIHAVIHFLLFGGAIDIVVNKIIYQKHLPNNISTHIFLVTTIILSSFVNQFMKFGKRVKYPGTPLLLVLEILLLIASSLQIFLGLHVYRKILKGKNPFTLKMFKMFHKINAGAILIISKAKIILLIYFFTIQLERAMFHIAWITYILLCLTVYLKFYLSCERSSKSSNNTQLVNQNFVYKDIKDAVENENLVQNISTVSIEESHDDSLKEINTSICNDLHWVILENKIFNMKNYVHPGGNMLIQNILKKDITKMFHGLDYYIFADKDGGPFKLLEYNHDVRGLNCLDTRYLSDINQEKMILNDEQDSSMTYYNKSASVLFNSILTTRTENSNPMPDSACEYQWKLSPISIDGCFSDKFMLAKQLNTFGDQSRLNLFIYWVKVLGRYFIVQDGNERYLAYNIMSLNPIYLQLRFEYFGEHFVELFHYIRTLDVKTLKYLSRAEQLDSKAKYISTNFPLYFTQKVVNKDSLVVKGPYGAGLGFNQHSTTNFTILIENDGIVPFLDFFEILIQQHLLESKKYEIQSWIFNSDYKFCYLNGLKLSFYWKIDDDFIDIAETIGFYHLKLLHYVNYKYGFNKDIIKEFYIKTTRFIDQEFNFAEPLPLNFNFTVDNIRDHVKYKAHNFIISGSKDFKKAVIESTVYDRLNPVNFILL